MKQYVLIGLVILAGCSAPDQTLHPVEETDIQTKLDICVMACGEGDIDLWSTEPWNDTCQGIYESFGEEELDVAIVRCNGNDL